MSISTESGDAVERINTNCDNTALVLCGQCTHAHGIPSVGFTLDLSTFVVPIIRNISGIKIDIV